MHTNTERSVLLASVLEIIKNPDLSNMNLIKETCHVAFWEDLSDAHGFPFHPCCGVRFCASPLEDRNDKDDLSHRNATSKQ